MAAEDNPVKRTAFKTALLALAGLALFGTIKLHLTAAAAPAPPEPTLKQIATIDLPGPAGKRFDYLTIDYDDGYLLPRISGPGCFMSSISKLIKW